MTGSTENSTRLLYEMTGFTENSTEILTTPRIFYTTCPTYSAEIPRV